MKAEDMKQLLDKYFEGQTSSSEEAILRDYFSQPDTNPEFDLYKPMFQFFTEERASLKEPEGKPIKEQFNRKRLLIWLSTGAAACLLLFVTLKTIRVSDALPMKTSVAYIDGKKLTDISTIRSELFDVLDDLDEGNEEIFSSQIELLEDLFN